LGAQENKSEKKEGEKGRRGHPHVSAAQRGGETWGTRKMGGREGWPIFFLAGKGKEIPV